MSESTPFIFISYSHQDANIVLPEIERLTNAGFEVWYDDGINPGASWRDELAEKIASCGLFLFFATERSIASDNCQQEVNFAVGRSKPILTVHLQSATLTPGMELALSHRQAIMKFELADDEYQARLVTAVGRQLSVQPTQTLSTTDSMPSRSPLPAYLIAGIAILALMTVVAILVIPGNTGGPDTEVAIEIPEELPPGIAVLPFENMSATEDSVFFTDGVHGDILAALSRINDLKVISRTSVLRFRGTEESIPEIASQLKVTHVLEGNVRRSGDRVRIGVQLIDAANDQQVWAEVYDRDLTDIFAVQSELASTIADKLETTLDLAVVEEIREGPTRNLAAWEQFAIGRALIVEEYDSRARDYLTEAIRLDPDFAEAYGLLAVLAVMESFLISDWPSKREEALNYAERALALDKNSTDARVGMGAVFFRDQRWEAAISHLDEAVALDPNNAWALFWLGISNIWSGDIKKGKSVLQANAEVSPLSFNGRLALARVALFEGNRAEVQHHLERTVQLNDDWPAHIEVAFVYQTFDGFRTLFHLHNVLQRNPDIAVAQHWLAAHLYKLGDPDTAIAWAERART
ncbi:MAG: TIR domain-containing protein, partial [Pseudomonadota bacterium]